MPFVLEKCGRKIRFEFINDDKLRAIQVLVRFHEPEPKEGYEYSRQWYCSIPSVVSESRQRDAKRGYKRSVDCQKEIA
jgi:hypothetical protein